MFAFLEVWIWNHRGEVLQWYVIVSSFHHDELLDATMAEELGKDVPFVITRSFSFKFQHLFELIDGHKQCKKTLDTDLGHCGMERRDLNRSLALQRFGHFR